MEVVESICPTPDEHCAPCPNSRMSKTGRGRVLCRYLFPGVGRWVISAARAKRLAARQLSKAPPHHHDIARPNRGVREPCPWGVHCGDWTPCVAYRVITVTCVESTELLAIATPDEHDAPRPNSSMTVSWRWKVIENPVDPRTRPSAWN